MKKNILTMKYPPSFYGYRWREGLPTGNGIVGALAFGGIENEFIMLSHCKLWTPSITEALPDVSDVLAKIRSELQNNRPENADQMLTDAIKNTGYNAEISYPLPLCDVKITAKCSEPFTEYERSIDMNSGEIKSAWSEGDFRIERKAFVSRIDNKVYIEISSQSNIINIDVSLIQHISDHEIPEQKIESSVLNNLLLFSGEKTENIHYGAGLKYKICKGTVYSENNIIKIRNAKRVSLCVAVFIDQPKSDGWKEVSTQLNSNTIDYKEAFEIHKLEHSRLFNAVEFDLFTAKNHSNEELLLEAYQKNASNEFIEKFWAYGRYLILCSTKENGLPCHMLGLWSGDYNATWAFNMFNENFQMIYWQVLSGNMPELLIPAFDYFETKMEDFRENAKKLFNCRGINIPSVSTPESGLHKVLYPHILYWTVAAGWIAQHYYDYYVYTHDVEFLRTRALPFMNETALFFEDFLFEGEDGTLVSSPSISPENTAKNIYEKFNKEIETSVNATMDFAIIKELLQNLLEGSKITGEYQEKREIWSKMLSKIPHYQKNEYGAIKEWIHPNYIDNYNHRHQSMIYPFFPGSEITKEDTEKVQLIKKAIEKRLLLGISEQTGWSLAHMANIYARLGSGEEAINCIHLLARSNVQNNFFTMHNDYRRMGIATCNDFASAPVQLDANMGVTAAIQEMFVSSIKDTIYLFNALPKQFNKGKIGPLLARQNIEIYLEWEQEHKAKVKIKAKKSDCKTIIKTPDSLKIKGQYGLVNEIVLQLKFNQTINLELIYLKEH